MKKHKIFWMIALLSFPAALFSCQQQPPQAALATEPAAEIASERAENQILDYLRQTHPDLSSSSPLVLQELNMQGETREQIDATIYQIADGPFQNQSFLFTGDLTLIPLGSADGGQGLTSLALSDLDRDQRSELYFTYSYGSGIHQSRLGVYAPAYDQSAVYEADLIYEGDLMLFSDQPSRVDVRSVEAKPDTKTIQYLATLGQITLSASNNLPDLQLELAEDLPREYLDAIHIP